MDTIHTIARGICIKDGNILLAYFIKDKYYFLPGGHIEPNESMIETLKREFMEETKIIIEPKKFISVFEHIWTNKNKTQHEVNFIFSVEAQAIHEIQSQESHLEFRWVPITEMRNIHFLPREMVQIIKDAVTNKTDICFSTTFKVKNRLMKKN